MLGDTTLRQALRGLALSSFAGYTDLLRFQNIRANHRMFFHRRQSVFFAARSARVRLRLTAIWYYTFRGVNTRYLTTVNSVVGSVMSNGRFNHKDDRLGVLYVGLTRGHVLSEVEEDAGTIFIPGLLVPPQYHVAVFHLELQRVLDVRRPDVQAALGTSAQELSGSWALENYTYRQHAPTQRLARIVAQEGVQAIRYLSVKAPQLENLAVFVPNVEAPVRAEPDPALPPQLVPDAQSTPELHG